MSWLLSPERRKRELDPVPTELIKTSLRKTSLIWLLVSTSFQEASVDRNSRYHRSSPYFSSPWSDAEWQVSCSRHESSARWGLHLHVCTRPELTYHQRVSKKWVLALQWHKVSQNFLRWKALSQQNFTRVVSLGHQLDNQYLRVYSRLLPLSPMHQGSLTPPALQCSNFTVSSASHADSQQHTVLFSSAVWIRICFVNNYIAHYTSSLYRERPASHRKKWVCSNIKKKKKRKKKRIM